MSQQKQKSKKAGRKRGKPSHQRYTKEKRWLINKAKRRIRRKKRLEKAARKRRERHEKLMNRER